MTSARQGIGAIGCLLAALALAGCGEAAPGSGARAAKASTGTSATSAVAKDPPARTPGATQARASSRGVAKEAADPLEADSYPVPASVKHASAATPAKAGESIVAAGAPSNAEIRSELAQMHAVERSVNQEQKLDLTPVPGGESVGGNGTIPIPTDVPEVVQKVIAGANEIADFPYVYGGGHASFVDNAYDCSGSVSYALAAGGLLSAPETSGQLESWGAPGPGRWLTVFANAGHTFMNVDGVWFDTAGRAGPYSTRWLTAKPSLAGYAIRHYPGL